MLSSNLGGGVPGYMGESGATTTFRTDHHLSDPHAAANELSQPSLPDVSPRRLPSLWTLAFALVCQTMICCSNSILESRACVFLQDMWNICTSWRGTPRTINVMRSLKPMRAKVICDNTTFLLLIVA